jgi:predicted nucleic acid-binding protein
MEATGAAVIVVDTNVVARLVIPGAGTPAAERVRDRDATWAAPALLRSEFRNVLVTSIRTGRIVHQTALQALQDADEVLGAGERPVSPESVLDLAQRSGCTAYDCEFVSVALDLGVPLVTSDRQVFVAFPEVAVSPETFVGH